MPSRPSARHVAGSGEKALTPRSREIVPFLAHLLAEEMHASGVLAVVMAGFHLGHRDPQAHPVARLQTRAVWQAADTLLEAFVFALIGLQPRGRIDDEVFRRIQHELDLEDAMLERERPGRVLRSRGDQRFAGLDVTRSAAGGGEAGVGV